LFLSLVTPPRGARTAELADLVEQVAPAVINIHTAGTVRNTWWSPFGSPFGYRQWTSLGSGFVVDPDGLIVTNHHVVRAATTIRVGLMDGSTYDATVVGLDPATDLALLSVDATGLPAVEFAAADSLRVGDSVFAVGNPFGYDHTVTSGIVSALHRDLEIGPYDDFLQTDASINPGNSGGPLFDMEGRVVGVNTAIHAGGEGLGFAVPGPMLAAILPLLEHGGEVVRGWPGVRLEEDTDGVRVAEVYPDGPGAAAGLAVGDHLVSVEGRRIRDRRGWTRALGGCFPGHSVRIAIERRDQLLDKRIELVDHEVWSEAFAGPPLEVPALGIWVRAPAPDRISSTGLDPEVGLEVVEVASTSRRAFFQRGDIIIEFLGQPLRDPMDLPPLAEKAAEKHRISAIVMRGGQMTRLFYRW